MTVRSSHEDGEKCRVQCQYPGSANHLAAIGKENSPVVIAYSEVARETLNKLSFHQLALHKHEMEYQDGLWHATALQ